MAAYDIAIFPQFFRNFPQFSAIFPQFSRNFSQLDSTPPDRNFSPPLHMDTNTCTHASTPVDTRCRLLIGLCLDDATVWQP